MKGIYIIKCLKNNKVYVGQTTNYRLRVNAHRCALRKGSGVQKLQIDWDLYDEDCFEFEFIQECSDKHSMNELEKHYIDVFNSIENGYNTSSGGIGQGNFGRHNGMYGRKHTDESKKLMSKNRKGLTSGSKNPNYGNHDNSKFTDEVRHKMSEKQKARWKRIKNNEDC